MASIANDQGGRRRILFIDPHGNRKTLRLGKIDRKSAEAVARHIEALVSSKVSGQPIPKETAAWLSSIGLTLRDKLAATGLIEGGAMQRIPTVQGWIESYIAERSTVKAATKASWKPVLVNLIDFLGKDRLISQVTPADADRFREYLMQAGLSPVTVYKRLQVARQFFRAMVRSRLLAENPFADLKTPNLSNAERMRFIDHETTQRILEACPDMHWRTIVALARYGGLRCPSEVLSLRWEAIDWERGRMRVDSPKTEHHHGGAFRIVPLFPELKPFLEMSWEEAPEGSIYVVHERFRQAALKAEIWKSVNLRTTFAKIVRKAGLELWPRLFQNLRSSRETELTEQFPVHVVSRWLGNTPRVADKHYLQVTEQHFAEAIEKAAQNPAQLPSEMLGNVLNSVHLGDEKTPVFPRVSEHCDILYKCKSGELGFEPRQADPESAVLPLHHSPINSSDLFS